MRPEVDVIVEDGRWNALRLGEVAQTACAAALAEASAGTGACEIAVLACGDDRIAELNARFRGRPMPANVLSWPAARTAAGHPQPGGGRALPHLGDIALAWETCSAEAEELRRPMARHVSHLIVHACLHLLGFRHETDKEAAEMRSLEVKALASIGISSPYDGTGLAEG